MLDFLKDYAPVVQAFLVPVMAAGVRMLTSIRNEIHELARLAERTQQWREDHEDRHERDAEILNREIDHIHERLSNGNGKDYTHR